MKVLLVFIFPALLSLSAQAARVDQNAEISCKTPMGESPELVLFTKADIEGNRDLYIDQKQIKRAICKTTKTEVSCSWGLGGYAKVNLSELKSYEKMDESVVYYVNGSVDTGLLDLKSELRCTGVEVLED